MNAFDSSNASLCAHKRGLSLERGGNGLQDRRHERLDVFEPIRASAQDDNGKRTIAQVLLIGQVLVEREEGIVLPRGGVEELAVAEIRPAFLVNRPGVVP